MSVKSLKLGLFLAVSSALTACGGSSGGNSADNSPNKQASVAMHYDMSAFLAQNLVTANASTMATSDQILRGELSATAIGGDNDGEVQTFTWTIYLNEDTFEATSNSTIDLAPGDYDFELLLTKGDQQYAGYSSQIVIDGENTVEMTIKPIIGDTVSDVTIIDQLAYFKFSYPTNDLTNLVDPSMGIQVDAGAEQVFDINTATGLSDTFVNLPAGQHNIELKLYDNAVQVGKSVDAQETQTISFGTDLVMDIVPLHGEVVFDLTENGADANVAIKVPAEVINEVGGVDNLTAVLSMVGTKNPVQETELFLTEQTDGSYLAEVVLQDVQYDAVTLALNFSDKTTGDQIATCNEALTLSNENQTFQCGIHLVRRAVVSGNILSVVGVNVVNEAGEPVSGAVISDASGILGVTGSGTFGTSGYAKLYLTSGTHELTAKDLATGQISVVSVTVSPLDIDNLVMTVADPLPTGFVASDWRFSGVGSYNMTESAINITSGGGGVTAATTITADGTISFDWAITVYSAGQYGDVIKYSVNGNYTTLSSAGSRSGSATNIAVHAGDTVTLETWGTTQSSYYSASFSNYTFTPN